MYGGPIAGGGPSLFVGSFSQPYAGPVLSGAGFGAAYIGQYPQYNGYATSAPGVVLRPPVNWNAVLYQPPPQISTISTTTPSTVPRPSGPSEGSKEAPNAQKPEPPPPIVVQAAIGRAHFTVTIPAAARLLVNDVETSQTGTSRRFSTPPTLDPTRAYEYVFRAQWTDGGQTVTRDRTVKFKAGDDLAVDFTQAAAR
jgi:uncharacterized protein (TIGR03000 family)